MKNSKITDTFKMMKTPVVSELGTKLGLKENEFAAIISYIDGDATDAQKSYAETVDEKIVERIREARNLYVAESQQFTTLIPKNSTKKDLAKKFLAYYYSDKALEITETTCKMILPVKYSDGTESRLPVNYGYNILSNTFDYTKVELNEDYGMVHNYAPVMGASVPVFTEDGVFCKAAYKNEYPEKEISEIKFVPKKDATVFVKKIEY